ncbi:MAG: antibiotic biosynthesis monooxygenase [Gammaproteobacteria bacterium]|jgi:autoinducer 2-degrading protein|nr:antibiotic biosynthesis monooxygenase [Gammaproteobacteria bacterium]
MHVTIVHVRVKPEFLAEFLLATRANHDGSLREPGNLRFDVLQDPNDPTRFVLYEAYASAEAAAAHKATPHYRTWKDAVAPWMAEARVGEPYLGLLPRVPTSAAGA